MKKLIVPLVIIVLLPVAFFFGGFVGQDNAPPPAPEKQSVIDAPPSGRRVYGGHKDCWMTSERSHPRWTRIDSGCKMKEHPDY